MVALSCTWPSSVMNFRTGRQGLEVVDAHTVKVLGDGDGLVYIAQAHLAAFCSTMNACAAEEHPGFVLGIRFTKV